MPPPELKATIMGIVSENKPVGSTAHEADLMGGDDIISMGAPTTNGQPAAPAQSNQDILAEIFGSSGSTTTSQPASQQQQQRSAVDDILGLFGSTTNPTTSSPAPSSFATSPPLATAAAPNPMSSLFSNSPTTYSPSPAQSPPVQPAAAPAPAPAAPAAPRLTAYTAYEKNDLKITLTPQTNAAKPGIVLVLAKFTVSGSLGASGINFQAAVPKSQQLQMLPMSNTSVEPGATETQQMRIVAPVGSTVRLRLRISFSIAGQNFQDQVDFAGFPAGLTGGSS